MNVSRIHSLTALVAGSVLIGAFTLATPALAAERGVKPMLTRPAVVGSVTAISGTTLTVTAKVPVREHASTTPVTATVYTVDASTASVVKNGKPTTIAAVAIGDAITVRGTVTGTNVAATAIMDETKTPRLGEGKGERSKNASTTPARPQQSPTFQGNGQPIVGGTLSAVSGSMLTVTTKSGIVYSVDATSSKILKVAVANPTVANLTVGDNVMVQGSVNGKSVTASTIVDRGTAVAAPASEPKKGGMMRAVGGFFTRMFGFF